MFVEVNDNNRVRTLTLNRPERLNAFGQQLVEDLVTALQGAEADASVSVVLLTGAGRAFSAGADLKEIADHVAAPTMPDPMEGSTFTTLIDVLAEFTKPLVIAVNGVGVGFGMTILGFADLVLMSDEAQLRCPFTDIGAPPEAASTYLLPLLVGRQEAAWALMSSEWISAPEARAIGLVWKVCAPEELLTIAHRHAEHLASKPLSTLSTVKRLLNAPHREQIRAAAGRENKAMSEFIENAANTEALAAFRHR